MLLNVIEMLRVMIRVSFIHITAKFVYSDVIHSSLLIYLFQLRCVMSVASFCCIVGHFWQQWSSFGLDAVSTITICIFQ